MHSRFLHYGVLCAVLLLVASCARDVTSPGAGPRTFVSTRVVGNTLPAKEFCTAPSPYLEQWVSLFRSQLVVYNDGSFALTVTDEQDAVQFTTASDGTRTVTEQYASGGARSVRGVLMPLRDGVREARIDGPTTLYTIPEDFTARVFSDSAVVTDKVRCLIPIGTDSAHVFTVILR